MHILTHMQPVAKVVSKGKGMHMVPVKKMEPLIDVNIPPAFIIDYINRRREERQRRDEDGRRIRAPSPTDRAPQKKREEPDVDSDGKSIIIPLHDEPNQREDEGVIRIYLR